MPNGEDCCWIDIYAPGFDKFLACISPKKTYHGKGPDKGYKRKRKRDFDPGLTEWIMAHLFDFVDVKDGKMHPAFVGGANLVDLDKKEKP